MNAVVALPLPFTASPCGGLQINVRGSDVVMRCGGALWLSAERTLVVADLHLEKGSSLARRGVHLPPYDTRQSLRQLQAVIRAVKPRRLIFLGDSFHDWEARERIDAADLHELRAITGNTDTIWITGNHDPAPPDDIGGAIMGEVVLGPVTLRHVPGVLPEGDMEIAGHLHPAAAIEQRGRRIRCRCFIADQRRMIMPAFGSYTGALGIGSAAFAGLFGDFHVWMLGGRAIHRFPAAKVR